MDNHLMESYFKKLSLNEETITEIMKCFKVKQYQCKEHFSRMGECSDKLGFVIQGLFYMHLQKADGSLYTKEFIREQEFLLASFDPNKESTVNIQALQDSIIMEAKYSDIQKLYNKYHDFERLSKIGMEKKIDQIYLKLESLALMEAKDRYRFFKQTYGDLESKIPQYIIASYLNITPTQLCRIKKLNQSINICK